MHKALAHQAELFPELDLAPLDTSGLEARDAAFAHAIYDAVQRRWITLEYLVSGYLSRGFGDLDPRLRAVLLAGTAQMVLLERVPPHAVLNESVEWAKRIVKPSAGGLVNAVLRKIASLVYGEQAGVPERVTRGAWSGARDEVPLGDGTAVKLQEAVFPEPQLERIAVVTSHPGGLLRKWEKTWSTDEAVRLATHDMVNPPTILNTRFAGRPVASAKPHELAGHSVFAGSRTDLLELLRSRDDVWVQDAASGLAIAGVQHLKPGVVVDACAGQGTKTRQLAATFPQARVIATDVDHRRLGALREVGRSNARIEVIEAQRLQDWKGKADFVLLDVPCSNTGVLPRRVEARYRCSPDQLSRLVEIQRGILRDATSLLAPGGAILYSTCSIEREENEDQVAWAQRELGLAGSEVKQSMPRGLPGEPGAGYHDGAFSAVLTRGGIEAIGGTWASRHEGVKPEML